MGRIGRIDEDRLMAALEESAYGYGSPGFCRACGTDVDGVEPDARHYRCPACGAREVFGAEELALMGIGW